MWPRLRLYEPGQGGVTSPVVVHEIWGEPAVASEDRNGRDEGEPATRETVTATQTSASPVAPNSADFVAPPVRDADPARYPESSWGGRSEGRAEPGTGAYPTGTDYSAPQAYPAAGEDRLGDYGAAGEYGAEQAYGPTSAFPAYQPYDYGPVEQAGWPEDAGPGYETEETAAGYDPAQGYGYAPRPQDAPPARDGAPDDGYVPPPEERQEYRRATEAEGEGAPRPAQAYRPVVNVPARPSAAAPAVEPAAARPGAAGAASHTAPDPGAGQAGGVRRPRIGPSGAPRPGAVDSRDDLGGALPVPPAPSVPDDPESRETADSLTSDALLHGKRPAPGVGWRRTIFKVTGGLVRVGESAAEQRRRELMWRARTPVAGGHHRVAVMSLKGGVGKTTTAVGIGATLATLRGDRVIAVDANPDRGTLSDKVRLETSATVRDLLNEREQIRRYADVRAFTSQAPSRLEVLASDRDPAVSVAFSEDDYYDVARVLEHYYSICLTDCGTGLLHSAMAGVLRLTDQIVLVSSPSVDGARSASATLDWLEAHDYGDLVRSAVVALSTVRPRSRSSIDLDRLEQHFATRSRAVIRIPYDAHLEEGAEFELDQLSPATTEAYLLLAATVGDGFATPRRAVRRTA